MASTKALIARAGARRVSLRVVGRLKAKGAGRVRLVVDRRVGGIWRTSRSIVVRVRDSRFTRELSVRGGESTRIRAIYSPAAGDAVHARPVTVRG
ncbi:MAG: hypothetical protein M3O90_00655 [Actinomycetota bacterium]|nr:hypothetical protein [Actinomycetota bacterium]